LDVVNICEGETIHFMSKNQVIITKIMTFLRSLNYVTVYKICSHFIRFILLSATLILATDKGLTNNMS
jgi:hypothetical protein